MKRQRQPVKKTRKEHRPPKVEKTPDGGFKMEIRDWRDMRDFLTVAYPRRTSE